MKQILLALALLIIAPAALAYIGPGAGISLVSSVLGILGAIFLGLFAVLAWPVRRMLKRRKAAREAADSNAVESAGGKQTETISDSSND